MELPCDICMWGLIPMIKRELVLKMNQEFKIPKADIARRLEITKGAVTQYTQGKRAANSSKLRKIRSLDNKIRGLAKELSKEKINPKKVTQKFCEICKIAQKKIDVH